MTIDEAIEILTDFHKQESELLGNEFKEASSLGIEALRHYQGERERRGATKTMWLPGETQ